MTDNVVKAGIEDVLSSVKRLVSEEGKAADQGAAGRKPGRLVLTDALRISKPAEVEQTPLKLDTEYSAETSAKPMLLRACDIVRDEAEVDQDAATETTVVPETELAEDPTTSLSAKIEALEAAIARTEDQWEPDGDSDDAYSGTPNQGLIWDTDAASEDDASADSLEEQPEDDQADSDIQQPEVEEQQPATFVRSAEVVPPAEPVEQDVPEPNGLTVDEEALRELIAEVVQQELRGALGERITRNVRKMVRREIYRALAAQELE